MLGDLIAGFSSPGIQSHQEYNHHIPQRAIGSKTPILALKEWQQKRPELFVKRVYDQTGLDS